MIATQHRPPHRPRDRVVLIGLARNRDRLVEALDVAPAIRRAIAVRIHGIGLEDDEVAPVGPRVGESPCDVGVAAGDERWYSRKRRSDETMRLGRVCGICFKKICAPRLAKNVRQQKRKRRMTDELQCAHLRAVG